ncbi:MAG: hypothetical protein KDG89_17565 [Geminicoccaceae bacterium]|nr:hypothetical protein [Geminicoccaceae bacterium]
MFTLSIGKILVLAAVIAALWRGTSLLRSLQASVDRLSKTQEKTPPPTRKREAVTPPAREVDLVPCPHCGAYVPNGTYCQDQAHCRMR